MLFFRYIYEVQNCTKSKIAVRLIEEKQTKIKNFMFILGFFTYSDLNYLSLSKAC